MPSLAEIGPVVLEKKIFKFRQCIVVLFRNYLPLEKGVAFYFNKLKSLLSKDALCQVWLKLAQWFLSKRWKCEKFTDGQTDGQQVIIKAHLSFQLWWAKKLYNLTLRSKIKVKLESWMYTTHRVMVIHPYVPNMVKQMWKQKEVTCQIQICTDRWTEWFLHTSLNLVCVGYNYSKLPEKLQMKS